MSNTNVSEIYESFNMDDANRYLADGWVIVAVVSGVRELAGKEEVGPVYVLGKPVAGKAGRLLSPKK